VSKPRPPFYRNPPPADIARDAPKDMAKREFANRLQARMIDKGLNQSELARRVEMELRKAEPDIKFGRDNISNWIRAVYMPNPTWLAALAKVLDCEPADLVPTRGVKSSESSSPPLMVRELEDGKLWLRLNMAVDFDIFLKIMALVEEQRKKEKDASD
jgi:transcriptional regulator with XRE-family HTH domain